MSPRRKRTLDDVIAERVFHRSDGKEVRARVARPSPREVDWGCEFQVLGVEHDKIYDVPGGDSLQALQLALAMMSIQLEEYQTKFGLTFDGDAELLLMMPDFDAMAKRLRARPDYLLWRP